MPHKRYVKRFFDTVRTLKGFENLSDPEDDEENDDDLSDSDLYPTVPAHEQENSRPVPSTSCIEPPKTPVRAKTPVRSKTPVPQSVVVQPTGKESAPPPPMQPVDVQPAREPKKRGRKPKNGSGSMENLAADLQQVPQSLQKKKVAQCVNCSFLGFIDFLLL